MEILVEMQHNVRILFEYIPKETLRWKKIILLWNTFTLLTKGNWLIVFRFRTINVLYNHYLFTKPGI